MDHVKDYRPPKDTEDMDDVTRHLREEGCAPKVPTVSSNKEDQEDGVPMKKAKKGEVTSCHLTLKAQ